MTSLKQPFEPPNQESEIEARVATWVLLYERVYKQLPGAYTKEEILTITNTIFATLRQW